MVDFTAGLLGGIAGGASAVGMLADNEIKRQNDIILNNNKLDFETRKAAMEDEIKMRAEERARSRLAKYAQGEVDVTTPGAATAVDDEGNSNAVNDIHTKRSKTLEEIRNAMLAGGDTGAANTLDAMVDRTADRESREKVAKLLADNRKSIAEGHDLTKWELGTDAEGNVIAKGGKGADGVNARLASLRDDIRYAHQDLARFDKQMEEYRKDLITPDAEKKTLMEKIQAKIDRTEAQIAGWRTDKQKLEGLITSGGAGMINTPTPTPGMPSNDKRGTKAMPLPMPASKDKAQKGVWYNTPRGLAMWNGTEFEQ